MEDDDFPYMAAIPAGFPPPLPEEPLCGEAREEEEDLRGLEEEDPPPPPEDEEEEEEEGEFLLGLSITGWEKEKI